MRFLAAIFSRQGFAILFLSAILGACTVVVDEGPGPRPPRPEPQFCPKHYEPVCAKRGGDRQTFANACLAERAGYRILRDGECRDGGGGGGGSRGGLVGGGGGGIGCLLGVGGDFTHGFTG